MGEREDYGEFFRKFSDAVNASVENPKKVKKVKSKKTFNVGDVIVMTKEKQGSLSSDAYDFLLLYGKFVIQGISEGGNLYLGFDKVNDKTGKMEKFYFSPNRFDLKTENSNFDFGIEFDED